MHTIPEQCRRRDNMLASVIDLAIAYQQASGYPQAKMYLMEQAVPYEIIRRVLAFPDRRRGGQTFLHSL